MASLVIQWLPTNFTSGKDDPTESQAMAASCHIVLELSPFVYCTLHIGKLDAWEGLANSHNSWLSGLYGKPWKGTFSTA